MKGFNLQKPQLIVKITSFFKIKRCIFLTKIMTTIGVELCDIYVYRDISLFLSIYTSYLSLRSDINCLLPNLIRNFRRRDNLTSFLFSLTRSEPLLYGGLVPRIFLSIERVCEQTSERPCSSLPIQFISLRSMHVVRSCLSLSRCPISCLADTDGTKKSAPNWPTRVTPRKEWPEKRARARPSLSSLGVTESRKVSTSFNNIEKNYFSLKAWSDHILYRDHILYCTVSLSGPENRFR